MTTPPPFAQDYDRLTPSGFITDNLWYHGTSSSLAEQIIRDGLKCNGDTQMQAAMQHTMATIGDSLPPEQLEPVFLCPAKSLAWYWALQTVRKRHARLGTDEQPVIITVRLDDTLNQQVKPDVGAASVLMHPEGEDFLAYLSGIYQAQQLPHPSLNPVQADRMDYLIKLGLAYIHCDVPSAMVSLLEA